MRKPRDVRHPVAFFLHGAGDALLALPALRALAAMFEGRLTLVCERSIQELLFHQLPVRRAVHIGATAPAGGDWPRACDFTFDGERIAREAGACDMFLALAPWRSKSLERLVDSLAPEWTVGLGEGWDVALPRRPDRHASAHVFEVARLFDPALEVEPFSGPPAFSAAARERAAEIVGLFPKGRRILALHNDTQARKTWDGGRLEGAVRGFLSRHSDFWAVSLGLDRPRKEWDDLRFVPCNGLPLDTSMCILQAADLFLGVDSCMLHLADLCRIPSVGLFGPTRLSEFGCRFAPHCHVDGGGAMAGVEVGSVAAGLERMASWGRG